MQILYTKTGSSGNCTVIYNDKDYLMIDCGIQLDKVNKAIGYKLSQIQNCIITHKHIDHAKYLPQILSRAITAYQFDDLGTTGNNLYLKNIKPLEVACILSYEVIPFEVVHYNSKENTKCLCVGYFIYDTINKQKMVFATDTHYIDNKFNACDIYMIECNYITQEKGGYKNEIEFINKTTEHRRLISHQSFETCIEFFKKQDLSKCKEIYLLHVSEDKEVDKNYILEQFEKEFNLTSKGIKIYI